MNIELTTASEHAPVEVLDLEVLTRSIAGQSSLLVQFLYRKGAQDRHLKVAPLSWYEASQLQLFSQKLAEARHPETVSVSLVDAGIKLTGSVRRLAGRWTTGRTICMESLPDASTTFERFTIHASCHDVSTYSRKLYNRLWEVFTRG